MSHTLIFPSPTIVVGAGRFGLALLERLAEDWQRLQLSSDDPSLKNLRLLHVRAPSDAPPEQWRHAERQFVEIAKYTGDGDLPSLALDMVILRSLGLVRYRDGTFQVAMPKDGGVVEKGGENKLVRRRYFEWLALHPDPIAAVERLEVLIDRNANLALFAKPLINRVRQGHSPRTLLRCISRVRAHAEGRDPSPWAWFARALRETRTTRGENLWHLDFQKEWLTRDDARGLLEGFAPEPLEKWSLWFKRTHHDWVNDPDPGELPLMESGLFDIDLPTPFVPQSRDVHSPIDPRHLLRVDWESNGWATQVTTEFGNIEFTPVDSSLFRLGMFDHDGGSRVQREAQSDFCDRLKQLGLHAHRGLVRLWVDLQRNRVEEQRNEYEESRRLVGIDEALRQSLEVLGELLVRPLLDKIEGAPPEGAFPKERGDAWVDGELLPQDPSDFLATLELERRGEQNQVRNALTTRLLELGFSSGDVDVSARRLFRSVTLEPLDIMGPDIHGPRAVEEGPDGEAHGLLEFRRVLNEETRHLFNFGHLSQYRHRPTRRPPRLTIYVVGDVGEPFSRVSMRSMLREIHAELLRAYAPIFENFREGFDRSLSVIPILWMPHPADAFGGLHPTENRCEEAAIIESIQGIRRWVETVPRGTRCIPQVVINSRVTDNAVLSQRAAIRQTRDFISFQTRNDLSREAWLRKTVVGPSGDDFFSSFSCHEIEFPAERAREYLANRLARDMIRQIKKGDLGATPEVDPDSLAPPELTDLVREPTGKTRKQTRKAAEGIGDHVEQRTQIRADLSGREVERLFDDRFEEELLGKIYARWRALTRARGDMDAMMNGLRRQTSDHLSQTLGTVRKTGDHLIDKHASDGGLKSAQAGFNQLESITREHLMQTEEQRARAQDICKGHRIPQTAPVASARQALVEASQDKPELGPMRFGLFLWLLMVPALGASLLTMIATAMALYQTPSWVEVAVGPLAPITGALLLFVPAWLILRQHMSVFVERLEHKLEELSDVAMRVVEGTGSSFGGSPSIRSFIEARLHLTSALAARNYALRVHERVVQDTSLAHRLSRSIDIQEDTLTRRAEDLGVRAQMAHASAGTEADDVSRLFSARDGQVLSSLVDPNQLKTYYDSLYGEERERMAMVPEFIEEVGGFSEWRKHACMSDTLEILRHTRDRFQTVVDRPVAEQYMFTDSVGESLERFVGAHYPNMGFGAKFSGYEGLDPDGVRVLCDTALILHPALARTFEEARRRPGSTPFTETLDIIETGIIPNSAYMFSFAQGIRPHSLRNLMRFESFHDRVRLPDDRTFPLSGEEVLYAGDAPINHFTGFADLRHDINRRVLALTNEQTQQARALEVGEIPETLADTSVSGETEEEIDEALEQMRTAVAAEPAPADPVDWSELEDAFEDLLERAERPVDLRTLLPEEVLTPRNLGLEEDAHG